jgi:hypothetical protein
MIKRALLLGLSLFVRKVFLIQLIFQLKLYKNNKRQIFHRSTWQCLKFWFWSNQQTEKDIETFVLTKFMVKKIQKPNDKMLRHQGSHLSVYGTDSPYIGGSVRVWSVRSLKQLHVREPWILQFWELSYF